MNSPLGAYLMTGRQEILQKTDIKKNSKLAVMFSGGKDSIAVLATIAKIFPHSELFLLTCNNGHMYPEEVKSKVVRNVNILRDAGLLNLNFSLEYFDLREILINLGIRSLHDDVQNYPTCYICCACKLVMHAVCASYCREHGIKVLTDGYNSKQKYYPEQVPPFHKLVTKIMQQEYDVETVSPLYQTLSEREAANDYLKAFGLNPDDFDREKGGQASCSLGGAFKAPRLKDGRIDKDFYYIFEKGSIDYTKEKLDILFNKNKIIQHREMGPIVKPSFPEQINNAMVSGENLLTVHK